MWFWAAFSYLFFLIWITYLLGIHMNSKYKMALHNLNIAPQNTETLPSFLLLFTVQLSSSIYPVPSSNTYQAPTYFIRGIHMQWKKEKH